MVKIKFLVKNLKMNFVNFAHIVYLSKFPTKKFQKIEIKIRHVIDVRNIFFHIGDILWFLLECCTWNFWWDKKNDKKLVQISSIGWNFDKSGLISEFFKQNCNNLVRRKLGLIKKYNKMWSRKLVYKMCNCAKKL